MAAEREFAVFVAERSTSLLRTAVLLCAGDVAAGEDLLQDTLVDVYKRWGTIREPASRYAFARRVLVRQAARRWKRSARERAGPLTLIEPTPADPDAELAVDVRRALHTLPFEQRAVIVLRYFEDLTEAQIAATLDCPPGTVKSRASLGLKKMAEILAPATTPTERNLT
jgi:RNA polymerase sigma-70 factor (sigma-E family)